MGASPPKTTSENMTARPADSRHRVSFYLTEKQIQNFLTAHGESGCTPETIRQYRSALYSFYEILSEDKRVFRGTLSQWHGALLEQGYSSRTAASRIAAVNALLDYLERRDFQWHTKLELSEVEAPELTRAEYIRLLQTAKEREDITLYLLVKTFAVTGLPIQCLKDLTREAVDCSEIRTERKKFSQAVSIPTMLRRELLDYAMREGVRSGPLFRSRTGRPFNRATITNRISRLGEDAGLEPGKTNPRNLKRLYHNTFAEYQRQADEWIQDSFARLLEEEEREAGWLAGRG